MVCKNCGHEVVENGVFCPKCGKRLDGKISCPKCQKLINETSEFCVYCGTKIGSKNVCPSCGTVFKGTFCPKCGISSVQPSENTEEQNDDSVFSKIERLLSPSLILCSLFVLFICSFFIGAKFSSSSLTDDLGIISSNTIFGYMKTVFDSLEMLSMVKDGGILSSVFIFNTVVLLINLCITGITLICAIITFSTNIGNNKEIKIKGFGLVSLISFVVTVCCFFSSSSISLFYVSNTVEKCLTSSLSASANAGLIVSLIVWLSVATLKKVKIFNKQSLSDFLLKTILGCVIAVLSVIILILLTNKTFSVSLVERESFVTTGEKIKISFSSAFAMTLIGELVLSGEIIPDGIVVGTVAMWIIQIVAIIIVAIILALTIKSLTSEKDKRNERIFALSIITSILSLAYTIAAATLSNLITSLFLSEFVVSEITIGAPISVLVLSLLVTVATITLSVRSILSQKES